MFENFVQKFKKPPPPIDPKMQEIIDYYKTPGNIKLPYYDTGLFGIENVGLCLDNLIQYYTDNFDDFLRTIFRDDIVFERIMLSLKFIINRKRLNIWKYPMEWRNKNFYKYACMWGSIHSLASKSDLQDWKDKNRDTYMEFRRPKKRHIHTNHNNHNNHTSNQKKNNSGGFPTALAVGYLAMAAGACN